MIKLFNLVKAIPRFKQILIIIIILASCVFTCGGDWQQDVVTITDTFTSPTYTRHVIINVNAAVLGASAPALVVTGTAGGLGFDADAEVVYPSWTVPGDWNGSSDIIMEIHWSSQSGDAIADGETVKFDMSYRSVGNSGEAVDNGTVVSVSVTYTQSGGGIDKEHIESVMTIDYDNGNQPLAVQDELYMQFDRDVGTDTYSGDAIVYLWHMQYQSNTMPQN